jgi:antitoxin component of MazEF toxin-antitoxin module
MEIAKLYKQGGSIVMAIPQKYLLTLGWKAGDKIIVILQGPRQMSLLKGSEQITFQEEALKALKAERKMLDEADHPHTD